MRRAEPTLGPVVVLGIEGDERVAGFDAALRRFGLPSAQVLDWRRFLADPEGSLPPLFAGGAGVLRIDSPGGGADVRRALERVRHSGAAQPSPEPVCFSDRVKLTGSGSSLRSARNDDGGEADDLSDAGRIVSHQSAVAGLVTAARAAQALAPPVVVSLHDPDAIRLFYDKRSCHVFMRTHGLPVPRALPPIRRFDALVEAMREHRIPRVFVKPRWGSGAAGIVALAVSDRGTAAYSAAEHRGAALHSTKTIRRLEGGEAGALVDAVLALDAHVEQWAPKAAVDGRGCDLRILVVDGEVAHATLRASPHPMTNLDLGARRAAPELLARKVAPRVWQAMLDDCQRFAALFPNVFQIAFDVAILAGGKRHVFFEVNAFGDLLRRVRHRGLDPYEWQVARLLARAEARPLASVPA